MQAKTARRRIGANTSQTANLQQPKMQQQPALMAAPRPQQVAASQRLKPKSQQLQSMMQQQAAAARAVLKPQQAAALQQLLRLRSLAVQRCEVGVLQVEFSWSLCILVGHCGTHWCGVSWRCKEEFEVLRPDS
jgi:hypothetical protein